MRRRAGIALAIVTAGLLLMPILGGVGTAQTTSPTIYTFEECEEGWTSQSDSAVPVAPAWERSSPGHESEFAFYLADYVDLQDESLISPVHTSDGKEMTVSYFLTYDVEAPDGEDIFDYVAFDWSTDGATWETLKTYAGQNEGFPEFVEDSATFTAPAGPFQVRFHFVSDDLFSSTTEGFAGVAVDNVKIPTARPAEATCDAVAPEPDPSGTPEPDPSGSPDPQPTPGPNPDPQPGGENPRGCTVKGTDKGETLRGTPGKDIICGLAGDDTIQGFGGGDLLFGDAGNDEISGGGGDDKLRGAKGKDTLSGGGGNDNHRGGGGADTCSDDSGKNTYKSCKR